MALLEFLDLPIEIIALVAAELSAKDVKHLRLANKAVSSATFDIFVSRIGEKSIPLTPDVLQWFDHGPDINKMWRYVSCVKVEELDAVATGAIDWISDMLGRAFTICKLNGRLKSLTLQTTTTNGLNAVLMAMQKSCFTPTTLSICPNARGAHLLMESYRDLYYMSSLGSCLRSVKNLTVKLSSRKVAKKDEELQWCRQFVKSNVIGIRQFLRLMPALRSLELHWHQVSGRAELENFFFDHCVETILAIQKLETCILVGIFASEAKLCRFLSETSARRITLNRVTVSGGISSLLKFLPNEKFDFFRLKDVFEQMGAKTSRRLRFKLTRKSEYPDMGEVVTQTDISVMNKAGMFFLLRGIAVNRLSLGSDQNIREKIRYMD